MAKWKSTTGKLEHEVSDIQSNKRRNNKTNNKTSTKQNTRPRCCVVYWCFWLVSAMKHRSWNLMNDMCLLRSMNRSTGDMWSKFSIEFGSSNPLRVNDLSNDAFEKGKLYLFGHVTTESSTKTLKATPPLSCQPVVFVGWTWHRLLTKTVW